MLVLGNLLPDSQKNSGWFIAVYAILAVEFLLFFMPAYFPEIGQRRARGRDYMGVGLRTLTERLAAIGEEAREAHEWAAKKALGALTGGDDVNEVLRDVSKRLDLMKSHATDVCRDGCYAAMICSEVVIQRGRRRLARMKSTSVHRRKLDTILRSAQELEKNQLAGPDELQAEYQKAWGQAEEMLVDAEENLADHRLEPYLWGGTVVLNITIALAGYLATRPG